LVIVQTQAHTVVLLTAKIQYTTPPYSHNHSIILLTFFLCCCSSFSSSQSELTEEELKLLKTQQIQFRTLAWLSRRGKGKKMATEMTRVSMLRDWFEALDADGSGDISVDELEEPLISIGLCGSKGELEDMISKYDSSGDGEIDFQEFVKMVMTKEEGGASNAMLKLFEDFSEGRLGDPLLPFSTLVHMYSRKQLFSAVMSEDPFEKESGQKVLKARIKREEIKAYEKAREERANAELACKKRRGSSMKVALSGSTKNTRSNVQDIMKDILGMGRFSAEEVRERRESMARVARRNSVVRLSEEEE